MNRTPPHTRPLGTLCLRQSWDQGTEFRNPGLKTWHYQLSVAPGMLVSVCLSEKQLLLATSLSSYRSVSKVQPTYFVNKVVLEYSQPAVDYFLCDHILLQR